MARYGDLDAVKLKVQRHLIPNTEDDGTVDSADAERWFLKLLDEEPTADVAPKSEVERLTIELDAMRGAANSYKMHYENAKVGAVKEFAESLETALLAGGIYPVIVKRTIHRLAEEMIRGEINQ